MDCDGLEYLICIFLDSGRFWLGNNLIWLLM